MKTIYLIFSILLFLIGCNSANKESEATAVKKIPIINLEKAIQSPTEPMKMSDFIESVEYIRPEYPASLVGTVFGISVNDKHLLLEVPDRLLCYTRQGKFLREIGKKGQGPKEHLGIRSSTLFDTIVAINSNFNRRILRYDVRGKYLGSFPVSNEVFKINMLDTNRVAVHLHHGISMNDPGLFVTAILNNQGDTVQLKKTASAYDKGIASSPAIWYCGDTVCVHTCINDTVYSVAGDNIAPRYILHQGKYKISREAFADIRLLETERNRYIGGLSCCETAGCVLLSFQFDKKRWIACYDKHSGETRAWAKQPDEVNKYGFLVGGGWENDIDGGCKLAGFNAVNTDYVAMSVLPDALITAFRENKQAGVAVKYPDRQQKLEQFVHSLNEDENPVVILYRLKKEYFYP